MSAYDPKQACELPEYFYVSERRTLGVTRLMSIKPETIQAHSHLGNYCTLGQMRPNLRQCEYLGFQLLILSCFEGMMEITMKRMIMVVGLATLVAFPAFAQAPSRAFPSDYANTCLLLPMDKSSMTHSPMLCGAGYEHETRAMPEIAEHA